MKSSVSCIFKCFGSVLSHPQR